MVERRRHSPVRRLKAAPDGAVRPSSRLERVTAEEWGVEVCPLCGTTLVLGDHVFRARIHGRTLEVCSECAMTAAPERPAPTWGRIPREDRVQAA
jgi:hypothetical protein